LTQVSEIITAQTQPHELLDRVLHWTTSVMHAAGASAYLIDPHGQVLYRAATTLPHPSEAPPPALEVGEGVAGWGAEHGQPAIINDVLEDWRCSYGAETGAPDFMATAILCVPLRMRDKMLGVVEVIDPVDGSPFTPADAELLTAVANQAAVVLENAQLYEILNQRVVQSESELAVTNRRLESERNLLETVLQSMTDGVVVTDLAQRVQLINPAAAALLPELSESARGRLLQQVLPEFRGSSPSHAEPALLKRGDRATPRLIEAHRAPLRAGDGVPEGVIIVFADVTEKRGIEQAKSDFVSFVAHEMRSPLTSIAGFSALLRRHGEGADKPLPSTARERYLTIIHDESERLTRLINNLLDVARIEAGRAINLQRETLDFAAVAMNAADAQRGYSDNHEIVCDLPPDLPPVMADRDKVKQILINLLSNALKYSPRGTVTIAARVNGQFMEVSIGDEGPGIPAEQREQLFERFSDTATTQRVTSSTGLGLFLTKHLVEAHGGHIWVESIEGQGSTFFFTLPLVAGIDE
jgi:signal transduction histidine kinase